MNYSVTVIMFRTSIGIRNWKNFAKNVIVDKINGKIQRGNFRGRRNSLRTQEQFCGRRVQKEMRFRLLSALNERQFQTVRQENAVIHPLFLRIRKSTENSGPDASTNCLVNSFPSPSFCSTLSTGPTTRFRLSEPKNFSPSFLPIVFFT